MSDNENPSKLFQSLRKSSGSSNQSVNNSELPNKSDMFARHLDYVRTVEAENENLKSSKEDMLILCNQEIAKIKSTYGNEIDALRKALDELTKEKYTTEYHNDKLLEENNNLKIKFARKIDATNELEKKFEEAEANLIKYRKNAENFDFVCADNKELTEKISLLREELKFESSKRIEAENRANSLSYEVEFNKKINSNSSIVSRECTSSLNNKAEAYYNDKFDKEMIALREELTQEFDNYKEQMEKVFNKKIEDLSTTNSKLNEKCNKLFYEKKSLQSEIDSMQNLIVTYESKISALTARDSRHAEIVAKINNDHDNFIKDTLEENSELKVKLNEMSAKVTALLNEKISNEKEACLFRSMLKGEQTRLNLGDATLQRKRKLDIEEPEISAWSKGNIKVFCNSSNDSNSIEIMNDGTNEVDINEWSIKMGTSTALDVEYTFAPRKIAPGGSLNVWNLGENVNEDEHNVVMNVSFPAVTDTFCCMLSNDMDETEATFELKLPAPKRKILKTKKHMDQEKCSMM